MPLLIRNRIQNLGLILRFLPHSNVIHRTQPSYSKSLELLLKKLLEHVSQDLEMYKFQFAAHQRVVPAIFGNVVCTFMIGQRILRVRRDRHASPPWR